VSENTAKPPERRDQFRSNVVWSLLDQFVALGLGFASLAVLARLIPTEEIGQLGVGISLLAFVGILDVAPATVLLRDQIDSSRLNRRLTALYGYAVLRLGILVGLSLIVAVVMPAHSSIELVMITGLYAISLGVIGIKSVSTEYMFSQYRQAQVTRVQIVTRIVQISMYSLIIIQPTIFTYLAITIVISSLELTYWLWVSFKAGYRVSGSFGEAVTEILFIVKDFAIWSHMIAKSLFIMYWMDSYLLQYFVSNREIGDYSLALRAGNFLWLIPAIFEKNMIVLLARAGSHRARMRYFSFLLKVHLVVTLIVFAAAAVALPLYLSRIVGIDSGRSANITALFIPLAIAMTIRNLSMPFDALILHRKYLFPFATRILIPLLVVAVVVLTFSGSRWGTLGMARANIVIYTMYSILISIYVLRTKLISPSVFLLNSTDRMYAVAVTKTTRQKINQLLGQVGSRG